MILAQWTALVLGAAAVFDDLRHRQVSNRLTAAGVAAGLLLGVGSAGWRGLGVAVGGAAVGFLVFLLFHLLGGMGGGDVKLMAAFGSMLGPSGILLAAVLAAIFGGLMAAATLLWKPRARTIPYAPAIVAAAWLSMLGKR
jgi:prepilin peptidase CpaA